MSLIEEIRQAVIEGQAKQVAEGRRGAGAGVAPETILHDGLIDAMQEVGRLFEEGEYFVPRCQSRRAREGCAGDRSHAGRPGR